MRHQRNDTVESSYYTAPILRKSYRKTLRTVEGVRVKMRNCFVPYVPMTGSTTSPTSEVNYDAGDAADEEEEAAAGSEERTVILSVEIENSNDTGLGFVVESVSLTISGGLAHATLIGWGPEGEDVFPLTLQGIDQYNLLYRVSFLTTSFDLSTGERGDQTSAGNRRHSLNSQSTSEEMRRYVAIDLKGHPYRPSTSSSLPSNQTTPDATIHETHFESYSSRWNCLLDLLTTQQADPPTFFNRPSEPLSANDAMPAPPSPFPASTSAAKTLALMNGTSPTTPVAPWTLPKGNQNRNSAAPTPSPSSILLSPGPQSGKFTPTAPSALLAAMNANASTTQLVLDPGTPTPRSDRFPHLPHLAGSGPPSRTSSAPPLGQTPTTPAFPAYTASDVSNPSVQASSSIVPASQGFVDASMSRNEIAGNMVVSVNLLPPSLSSSSKNESRPVRRNGNIVIYPHDIFALDIFVLNLSGEVRRCEVGWPGARRRREREDVRVGEKAQGGGLMPLENKIRVGWVPVCIESS